MFTVMIYLTPATTCKEQDTFTGHTLQNFRKSGKKTECTTSCSSSDETGSFYSSFVIHFCQYNI